MSRESKQRIKAQRREARKRAEKTRRQLADHCAQWMYDAEEAWFAKDLPRARRCFQRILHVRPTHQAANERMAELFFIDGLQAEGLHHFDRLVGPPEFPIIDFRAAAACLITERFDQAAKLAQRFLRRTEDDGLMDAYTSSRKKKEPDRPPACDTGFRMPRARLGSYTPAPAPL